MIIWNSEAPTEGVLNVIVSKSMALATRFVSLHALLKWVWYSINGAGRERAGKEIVR